MRSVYEWAGVRYVITKFSRMDSLPNFVTHGAPLRALRSRESSAIINYYRFPPWPVLNASNRYRLCSTLIIIIIIINILGKINIFGEMFGI